MKKFFNIFSLVNAFLKNAELGTKKYKVIMEVKYTETYHVQASSENEAIVMCTLGKLGGIEPTSFTRHSSDVWDVIELPSE